jgi:EAL domain-containing protein (putative c-di-GMP-specific phosphodiesterase class I)
MITGLVVFGFLAGHRRDVSAYRGVLVLVLVALGSVAFDVAVLYTTAVQGPEVLGFQFDRIRELANAGFLFAIPLGLASILPPGRPERVVATIAWKIGLGLFGVIAVIAFASPHLFVSVTNELTRRGASIYSTDYGRGETGIVFAIRDGLLAVSLLVAFIVSGWGLAAGSITGSNRLIVVGVVIGMALGASAIYANFTGNYPGPLADLPFSRVTTATTVFTVLAIGSYVIRYVQQSRSLDEANRELEARRDELAFLAFHNAGTRIPNKQAALRDIDALFAGRDDTDLGSAYLCALDSVGVIEDSYGSAASEFVLRTIGRRLDELLAHLAPEGPEIYHIEGSNFVVLLRDQITDGDREAIESGLLAATSTAIHFEEQILYPGATIGHCEITRDAADAEGVLRRLKRSVASDSEGRGVVRRYSASIHESVGENQRLIQELRAAVERDEFTMVYQPIINRSGEISAAEALIRWENADTERFILLAEQSGLIVPITDFVARTVCADLKRIREAHPDIKIHLNVSAGHVHEVDLQASLQRYLSHHGLDPSCIGVEVTETSFSKESHAIVAILSDLRAAGFGVAIDDFGTGYSSLSYLKEIPADRLKIDRSFVMKLPASAADRALVDAAIVLGHELGKHVVAEGVETVEQRAYLEERGVDYFQGYLFAKPVTVEAFLELEPPGALASV